MGDMISSKGDSFADSGIGEIFRSLQRRSVGGGSQSLRLSVSSFVFDVHSNVGISSGILSQLEEDNAALGLPFFILWSREKSLHLQYSAITSIIGPDDLADFKLIRSNLRN